MMAALIAKNKNNKVTILERNNNCGKKILITGNGRCNYLNDDFEISHYRSNNIEFLENIINENNKKIIIEQFKKMGIEPKIKNGYYYPMSNQAVSIQNTFLLEMKNKGIEIINNYEVTKIEKKEKFIINDSLTCDKLIIAAGGSASPKCGTDGSIYNILNKLGLKIIKPLPALVQLKSNYIPKWEGIRTDVNLSLYENNKFIKSSKGEIQLTNYGISGIVTFQLSGLAIKALDKKNNVNIKINFLPEIDYDEYIKTHTELLKVRNIIELFEGLINYKLLYVLTKEINNNKKYNELSNKEKEILKENLTNYNLKITGYNDFEKAQVSQGGVSLEEINDSFETKKIKDLYIIGETLDVDGDCGGYNLGFAFLSGIIAGRNIND